MENINRVGMRSEYRKQHWGYNNAQQLVVFSTNIPTYSITAFWANGDYGTHKWRGLFQRTVKD